MAPEFVESIPGLLVSTNAAPPARMVTDQFRLGADAPLSSVEAGIAKLQDGIDTLTAEMRAFRAEQRGRA